MRVCVLGYLLVVRHAKHNFKGELFHQALVHGDDAALFVEVDPTNIMHTANLHLGS